MHPLLTGIESPSVPIFLATTFPGSHWNSLDVFVEASHQDFSDAYGGADMTVFSAFDVGYESCNGDTWHPSYSLGLVTRRGIDYLSVIQYSRGGKHDPRETVTGLSVPNDRWTTIQSLQLDHTLWVAVDEDWVSYRISDMSRIGLASGTHWGVYAGPGLRKARVFIDRIQCAMVSQ